MLALYHWEPNANSGKPMLALAGQYPETLFEDSRRKVGLVLVKVEAALGESAWLAGAHARAPGPEHSRWV
jgi:hypothetical protein